MRERSWRTFQRLLQFADGALEDGNLRHRIARTFQFRTDLILEIRGVTDAVDEEVEEAFGGKQALSLEFFNGLVADGDIGAAEVEYHIVVTAFADPFKT